jgi:RNA polymerase sigma-70 factor (ECF subfamily)
MDTKPDAYYIDQTLNGNVNAFAFLVERYKHMVYTLVIRIVKDKEDAEEIAQDVFVKSYQKLNGFKGDSKFSTWLYKIAYYASLDALRRNRKQIRIENIEQLHDGDMESVQDALDYLHDEERKKVIRNALLKLNEVERTIMTLYYFEEISLKEISKIVNLTADNVKIKLFRSRKKLFSILKNVIEPRTINMI